MAKEQRKSVNFDKNARVSEFDDEWDTDSEPEEEPQISVPETNVKIVEEVELNDVVQRKPGDYRVSVNGSGKRSSLRRGSMMLGASRRGTIYEQKPEDFFYDPTLEGPMDARIITDICCFMLFFVFLAIWIFSTCLVFNMGNLERFGVPKLTTADKNPEKYQLCGKNENANNRYEFNFNLFNCIDPLVAFKKCETKSVCVSDCPTLSYSFPYYRAKRDYDGGAPPPGKLLDALQCTGNFPNLRRMAEVEKVIDSKQCAAITTKTFVLEYKSFKYKCIPDLLQTEIDFIIDLLDNIVPQTNVPWRITYEFAKRIGHNNTVAANSTLTEHKTLYTFSDMLQGKAVLISFLAVGLILTLLLVYSMQFFARFIFIISNVFNAAILGVSFYMCYASGGVFDNFSLNIFKNDIWSLLLIFSSIVMIIVLIQFFIERTGTLIILELIKETTRTIGSIKTLLVFPLIFYGIRISAIVVSMYIGFTIKSIRETDFKLVNTGAKNSSCDCNDYTEGGFCNPTLINECLLDFSMRGLKYCKYECSVALTERLHENLVGFSQLTNLVGYFWALEYLYLLELAILAITFATYYWTFYKDEIPTFTLLNGFYMCVRYHLGTIFFAWLFLSVYAYIRFQSELIDGLLGFLPFSLIHFFFKYVVIVMALCGDDFYESAKEVIRLVKANARLIIISKFMSEILFFYLKLLITVVMGLLVYIAVLCFSLFKPGYFKNDMFPVYMVCMGTYLIATEIFNIYILGVDTFTFCYIEDITLNNGTNQLPYYMPRSLMKICNIQNKLHSDSYNSHKNPKPVKQ